MLKNTIAHYLETQRLLTILVSVAAKESFLLESNPNTEDEHQISEQSVEKSDESEKDGSTQEKVNE